MKTSPSEQRERKASRLLIALILVISLAAILGAWFALSPAPGSGEVRWRGLDTGFDQTTPADGRKTTEGRR